MEIKRLTTPILRLAFGCFVYATASVGGLAQDPIQQTYDRFKDVTSVRLILTPIPAGPKGSEAWISSEFTYEGQVPTRPKHVALAFVFASEATFAASALAVPATFCAAPAAWPATLAASSFAVSVFEADAGLPEDTPEP